MPRLAGKGYERPDISSDADELLVELADARGISVTTLTDAGVHVDFDASYYFPIYLPYPNMQGIWYERQRRWIGDTDIPKYLSPKGADPHLYNPTLVGPGTATVWVCEGEFDALSMADIGRDAVGIAGTQTFDGRWAQLFRYTEVVFALDGDESGRTARSKISRFFPEERSHFFDLPDGADMNGIHQEGALLNMVERFEQEMGL